MTEPFRDEPAPDRSGQVSRTPRATTVLVAIAVGLGLLVAIATVLAVRASRSTQSSGEHVHGELGLGVSGLGQAAPTFTLPRLSGDGVLHLDDYRGHILVLNFWRSDCTPCRAEFPLLRDDAHGAQVIGISTDSIPSDGRVFVASEHAHWPQALDRHLTVAQAYGLRNSLPQTFFVRRNGTIAYHVFGQLNTKLLHTGITAAQKRGDSAP
jgi:peroxiredoxin